MPIKNCYINHFQPTAATAAAATAADCVKAHCCSSSRLATGHKLLTRRARAGPHTVWQFTKSCHAPTRNPTSTLSISRGIRYGFCYICSFARKKISSSLHFMLWWDGRRHCHTPNYDHSDTIYWHYAKDADVALVPDSSLEFSLGLQVCRHWDGNDGQRSEHCQPTRVYATRLRRWPFRKPNGHTHLTLDHADCPLLAFGIF